MPGFTVETNAPEVGALIGRLFRDQIPFSTSRAINATAKDFQRVQRRHMADEFEVRRKRFVEGAVKIKPFATKRRLEAVVSIDPPGGKARADILTKFESAREKFPYSGNTIAVPVDVRRTASGLVSRPLRPGNLGLHHVAGRMSKGDRRTFAIRDGEGGTGAIFQRFGRRGATSIRILYLLVKRVPIDPGLDFYENAERVVAREFQGHFDREFTNAVRTAR